MPSPIAQPGHPKMGGIKKGTKHKRTLAREELASSGITPLEYLKQVACDPTVPRSHRIDAAKAAAPYLHRKMPTQIELRNITDLTDEELRRIAEHSAASNTDDDSEDD